MANPLYTPLFRFPGGVGFKVYIFDAGGTTTPASSYADPAGAGLNTWPVVLADAGDESGDGVADIFLDQDCTILIKDVDDATVPGYPAQWVRPIQKSELDAVETALSNRLDGHDSDIYALQQADILLDGRLDVLESWKTTASGQISTLQGKMTTANSNIGTLQGQMTTANSNISNLQGRMSSAESTISSLQSQVTALANSLQASVGGSNYSWDKMSDTLTQWGSVVTGSDGIGSVTFDVAYDSAPQVIPAINWGYTDDMPIVKLNGNPTTTGFSVRTKYEGGDYSNMVVYWMSIGKKVG